MSVQKINIRNAKKLQKKARINKGLVAASVVAVAIGAAGVGALKEQASTFETVNVKATTEAEVLEQIEERYDCDFSNSEYKDVIVDYCIDSNQYAVNPSVQNRMDLVSSARSLANASEKRLKEQMQAGDPNHEWYQLEGGYDSSVDPHFSVRAVKENVYGLTDTFELPQESQDLYESAFKIFEYQGTGESSAWDEQIGEFSREANQLFENFIETYDYDLSLDKEMGSFDKVPAQISNVKGM